MTEEGRRRLPFAALSSWQKQSAVRGPGQAPLSPTRQMIPWAWEIHLARNSWRGGREYRFLVPGEVTELHYYKNALMSKTVGGSEIARPPNGCWFARVVAVTAVLMDSAELRRAPTE